MEKKRIVITGIGVISPIGIGKDAYWQALQEGKSGIKPITLFDTSDLKVGVGGEITEFEPKDFLGSKGLRTLDRATTLLNSTTKLALEDGQLEINEENTRQIGVTIGTTFGSLRSISEFDKKAIVAGPRYVNPSTFPNTVINSPAGQVSIRFQIKGFNATISTGMSSTLDALEYAVDFIKLNRAKIVVVGSVEEMCVQTFLGFYKLNYLSGMNGDSGPISCPFDKRRNGIIFSEGSTVILLEELESAEQRKATIYGEILGIGSSFDPFKIHRYNPKGLGMRETMEAALQDANIDSKEIDCIFANANSTKDADSIETKAIKEVFSEYVHKISVTAIKSMLGETYSVSGGLATVAALGSINQNFIPATINYKEKDPDCDLDYVPNKVRRQKVNKVMINSFGPNGANTSLVIGRYE